MYARCDDTSSEQASRCFFALPARLLAHTPPLRLP